MNMFEVVLKGKPEKDEMVTVTWMYGNESIIAPAVVGLEING